MLVNIGIFCLVNRLTLACVGSISEGGVLFPAFVAAAGETGKARQAGGGAFQSPEHQHQCDRISQ
jgi:hypothetical protein